MAGTCNLNYCGKLKIGEAWSRLVPGINMRFYLQNNQSKKGCRHGSSSRAPPHKHKALSSNSSTAKKTKLKKKKTSQDKGKNMKVDHYNTIS
jgi:hypothetical protein